MNILLLGSGGREHAMAWKMHQSNLCSKLFVAPGNAGTASIATNLPFSAADFESVKKTCVEEKIDLLVVGPEDPLVKGLVDELNNTGELKNLKIIGPNKNAAQLEGSKAFAKAFMQRHGIPTAAYREFTAEDFEDGLEYLKQHSMPVVLKADGLAAGKGVIICQNAVEAVAEFELMIQKSKFGEAGKRVVVEEFLSGLELSVFALSDGNHYVLLPSAKDYKRVGEGDKGLNTGGMGAISPVPFADDVFMKKIKEKVIEPTISGLKKDNIDYGGFIFFGLIKVNEEPFVIEYNCRMGDPETEVVIPRIKSDLVALLNAAGEKKLDEFTIEVDDRYATTIMAVSGGYPGEHQTGFAINGLETETENAVLFQAGTKLQDDQVVTSGGRVLCATGFGQTLAEALSNSRKRLEQVSFEGMYFRKDIGFEFTDK